MDPEQPNTQNPVTPPQPPDLNQSIQSQPVNSQPPPVQKKSGLFHFSFKKFFMILFIFFILVIIASVYLLKTNKQVIEYADKAATMKQAIQDAKSSKSEPGIVITKPVFQPQTPNGTTANSQTSQNQTFQSNQSSQTNQTAQNNTSVTGNTGTQSWNTYQNKGYKFSVDFPGNLQMQEKVQGFGVSSIDFKYPQAAADDAAEFQMLTLPKSFGKMVGQDFDEFYAMSPNESKIIGTKDTGQQKITKIRNRSVNGLRAYDFQSTANPPEPEEELTIGTSIETGTSTVMITSWESNRNDFEKMLSTFKYPL